MDIRVKTSANENDVCSGNFSSNDSKKLTVMSDQSACRRRTAVSIAL